MENIPSRVSKLSVALKGNILRIDYDRKRKTPDDSVEIDINQLKANQIYFTNVLVKSNFFKHRVIFFERIKGSSDWLVVYTSNRQVQYYRHESIATHPLTRLITIKSKVGYLRLTKRGIRLVYVLAIENKCKIPIKASYLTISNNVKVKKDFPVYTFFPSVLRIMKHVYTDYIPLVKLLEGEPPINVPISASLDLGGDQLAHHTITRSSIFMKSPKWYYAPLTQTRLNDYSVSIRRTPHAGLVLVRRRLEPVEYSLFFRFIESKPVSFFLYHSAHLVRRLSRRPVNIYFEKNANQAEEGALDIFRKARDNSPTSNYFIINKTSKDYARLEGEQNVIKNFTLKSYWLIYRANTVIATEVPQHVNILRSGNKYIRRAPFSQKFVFLQHGIIYLKSLSKTTSFSSGREGEPDYMVVSSEKERDIVADLLEIEEERQLNVGLLAFDKINFGHVSTDSQDIATIMLTWRSYEEHLQDFTKSSYYQTVLEAYNILKPLLGKENVRIVAHPKFKKLLASTDIADVIWDGSIADILKETKLLITDYSSVCYNVFYQGGGVVFYQPDLDRYEQNEGKLIPGNDEYIGYRVHTDNDFKSLMNIHIKNRKINLNSLRTKDFTNNYKSINEHYDGRNVDRLYDELRDIKIV